MNFRLKFIFFIFLSLFVTQKIYSQPEQIKPLEILKDIDMAITSNEQIFQEYTAHLIKQEAFKGKLRKPERILLKYKNGNIYMKWLKGPFKGQEVIYNKNRKDGKIKAHKGGLAGVVSLYLDPRGKMATKGQHHPITDAGLEKLCKILKKTLVKSMANNHIEIKNYGYIKSQGKTLRKTEFIFPKPCPGLEYTAQNNENLWDISDKFETDMHVMLSLNKKIDSPWDLGKGDKIFVPHYPSYRTIIYSDEKNIPVRLEIFDWENRPYEIIEYKNINFSPGLKEIDFSPENKDYRF